MCGLSCWGDTKVRQDDEWCCGVKGGKEGIRPGVWDSSARQWWRYACDSFLTFRAARRRPGREHADQECMWQGPDLLNRKRWTRRARKCGSTKAYLFHAPFNTDLEKCLQQNSQPAFTTALFPVKVLLWHGSDPEEWHFCLTGGGGISCFWYSSPIPRMSWEVAFSRAYSKPICVLLSQYWGY